MNLEYQAKLEGVNCDRQSHKDTGWLEYRTRFVGYKIKVYKPSKTC